MAKIKSEWGEITAQGIQGDAWRVVESQEQIATLGLVTNLSEQHLLEHMLDESKLNLTEEAGKLDYLLFTPFRYPPLKWGSRFGTESERGIFYGSKELPTALAEVAYYRHLFWDGMLEPPKNTIQTQHTGFQTHYKMSNGVDVSKILFNSNDDSKQLTSKSSYSFTQTLGSYLRENNVDGLCFISARSPDTGQNIALFEPSTLFKQKPFNKTEIVCELNQDTVSFTLMHGRLSTYHQFSRKNFSLGIEI